MDIFNLPGDDHDEKFEAITSSVASATRPHWDELDALLLELDDDEDLHRRIESLVVSIENAATAAAFAQGVEWARSVTVA